MSSPRSIAIQANFTYGSGGRHIGKRLGISYVNRPELRSMPGARVDEGRRAG